MDTQFNQFLKKSGVYGVVNFVSHPIVFIEGLPKTTVHELIYFETGQKGEVFSINHGQVEARLFSHDPVRVGTRVTRSNEIISVPVGRSLLGHTINPLGEPLDSSVVYDKPEESRKLYAGEPIGISGREKISQQLTTGISLLDLLIPIGKGQRELIVGDRKTGKTSLVLSTIKSQVEQGVVAIYAAIAKKKSDIKKIQEFFINENIMSNIIIVATTSFDSPTLIYQTPYAAMTIAEYFRDEGVDTLIILDDLSTHAKFYREISLLARRFPGRESYPGDIFYAHSHLLERAGNFIIPNNKEVSITCLPIVEIVEGDLAGYISTNSMGITDGHIYMDSNIYYQGRRPAVNIPLSVTRVGRQTLNKLSRELNKLLVSFVNQYERLLNLSHFGQELTPEVKQSLQVGDIMFKYFNQSYQQIIPHSIQLIIVAMILKGFVDSKDNLDKFTNGILLRNFEPDVHNWLDQIASAPNLNEFYEVITTNKNALLSLSQ